MSSNTPSLPPDDFPETPQQIHNDQSTPTAPGGMPIPLHSATFAQTSHVHEYFNPFSRTRYGPVEYSPPGSAEMIYTPETHPSQSFSSQQGPVYTGPGALRSLPTPVLAEIPGLTQLH